MAKPPRDAPEPVRKASDSVVARMLAEMCKITDSGDLLDVMYRIGKESPFSFPWEASELHFYPWVANVPVAVLKARLGIPLVDHLLQMPGDVVVVCDEAYRGKDGLWAVVVESAHSGDSTAAYLMEEYPVTLMAKHFSTPDGDAYSITAAQLSTCLKLTP